jgi:hypothetical protein
MNITAAYILYEMCDKIGDEKYQQIAHSVAQPYGKRRLKACITAIKIRQSVKNKKEHRRQFH